MSARGLTRSRLDRALLAALDAITYALGIVLVSTTGAFALAVGGGGDMGVVKTLLFLCGWLVITYATVRMWPRSPQDMHSGETNPDRGGRFQRFVGVLPPQRWVDRELRPNERLSTAAKQFVGGVCVLAVSFTMEVAGV